MRGNYHSPRIFYLRIISISFQELKIFKGSFFKKEGGKNHPPFFTIAKMASTISLVTSSTERLASILINRPAARRISICKAFEMIEVVFSNSCLPAGRRANRRIVTARNNGEGQSTFFVRIEKE